MTTRSRPRTTQSKAKDDFELPPANRLLISVALNNAGATYSLDVRSELQLKTAYPHARGLPLVFLGYEKEAEFAERHRPYWELISQLLTDLTPEQISQQGGICIYQPREGCRILWEWMPQAGEGSGFKTRLVETG